MKKLFVTFVVLGLLGFVGVGLFNLFFEKSLGIQSAGTTSPVFSEVVHLLSKKCTNCHTDKTKLPFYMKMPGAKEMIEKDVREGMAYARLDEEFKNAPMQPVREVTLAKLEFVLENNSMPPVQYLILHWDSWFNSKQKKVVLDWIRSERAAHYASPLAKEESLRGKVLQPIPMPLEPDPKKVALGKELFHDPRLSKDNTISCASCHDLNTGGTDQTQVSTGVAGAKGGINAPTVYNASLNFAQFWDGRVANLFEQADGPVNNPIEMASNWPEVLSKLKKDKAFLKRYRSVYSNKLNERNLREAIATFEETLLTPGSDFDKYLLGDISAVDGNAKAGYELFVTLGCATCHVGMALGGQSYEKMGRKANYFVDRGDVKQEDYGRFNVTHREEDRYRFKVPILRNIAFTAPYFHDGMARNLEEAVEVMAKYEIGKTLTEQERTQILEFLRALTGEYEDKLLQ